MHVHIGGWGLHVALEGGVEGARVLPEAAEPGDVACVQAGVQVGALQGVHYGAHAGL